VQPPALELIVDGSSSLLNKTWEDVCLLPVHLEPKRYSLWCHHLKCRYRTQPRKSKQRKTQ